MAICYFYLLHAYSLPYSALGCSSPPPPLATNPLKVELFTGFDAAEGLVGANPLCTFVWLSTVLYFATPVMVTPTQYRTLREFLVRAGLLID